MQDRSIWTGIRRGLTGRCPNCGEARLFGRFLKVVPTCPVCGNDNAAYPSDDMPPYLTIVAVGHLVIPLFMWVDHVYAPAMWLQFATWLPLTAALSVLLLQPLKGAVIGLCWATGVLRSVAAVRR
jgi:uncharacterized protein (DUF983 family)